MHDVAIETSFLSHQFFSYASPNVLLCQHYAHMLLAPIMLKILCYIASIIRKTLVPSGVESELIMRIGMEWDSMEWDSSY